MTNYITSVGVQQVSITIAAGNLTGTATITAVGAGAYIVYQGLNPNDTAAQLDDTQAYVTLTNSTTLTATRGVTGTSKTIIVNAVVVDGDTTNLIKSVQFGTVTIAASAFSGTASISAVTNANTAIQYLGQDTVGSVTALSRFKAVVSLSGTTVTASVQLSATQNTTIGFCVIEFQGSALQSSVQNIAYSAANGASNASTVSLTSVTAGNAFVIYGGQNCQNGTNEASGYMYGRLTNATTFTITWTTTGGFVRNYNATLVELKAGILNQSIQRGTISISAATSNTATITSSSASNGFCNWLGNSSAQTTLEPAISEYKITQTNATTLTMTTNTADTGTGSYEVVEFPAYVAPSVQTVDALWFGMTF